jgi:hypothetical protein
VGGNKMSYEPKWYIVQYEVDGKEDQELIQAEDAYEAISRLRVDVPNASIDGVYVQVDLHDEDEEYDEDEEEDDE